ncbi:hypothetical protein SGCOL_010213 [Colletotrichum sp. CLE4]
MAYVFDGYSEASSGRNTPRGQQGPGSGGGGGGGGGSRQQRRYGSGDIPVGGLPGGIYYGTGRFYEENLRTEQRRRQQQQQQQQEENQQRRQQGQNQGQQRHRHDPQWRQGEQGGQHRDDMREASDAARAFLEALQRDYDRRRQQEADTGVGGFGPGPSSGYGEVGEDDFGPMEEIRFEDLFGDLFGVLGDGGGAGMGGNVGGGTGAFGPHSGPGSGQGRTDTGPGPRHDHEEDGGGRGPEPVPGCGRNGGASRPGYEQPPAHYGGGWYDYRPGTTGARRGGGAGMTFADFFELWQSWPGPGGNLGLDDFGEMPEAYF